MLKTKKNNKNNKNKAITKEMRKTIEKKGISVGSALIQSMLCSKFFISFYLEHTTTFFHECVIGVCVCVCVITTAFTTFTKREKNAYLSDGTLDNQRNGYTHCALTLFKSIRNVCISTMYMETEGTIIKMELSNFGNLVETTPIRHSPMISRSAKRYFFSSSRAIGYWK